MNKNKYKEDVQQYISEGIIREVFEGDGLTVTCFANSAYVIFLHGVIDKTNNQTVAFGLRGSEFADFMEEPTLETFRWLNEACLQVGQNRAFTLNEQLMAKFRELKKRLEAEGKVEVDLALEKQLVDEAEKKYGSTGLGGKYRSSMKKRNIFKGR